MAVPKPGATVLGLPATTLLFDEATGARSSAFCSLDMLLIATASTRSLLGHDKRWRTHGDPDRGSIGVGFTASGVADVDSPGNVWEWNSSLLPL